MLLFSQNQFSDPALSGDSESLHRALQHPYSLHKSFDPALISLLDLSTFTTLFEYFLYSYESKVRSITRRNREEGNILASRNRDITHPENEVRHTNNTIRLLRPMFGTILAVGDGLVVPITGE